MLSAVASACYLSASSPAAFLSERLGALVLMVIFSFLLTAAFLSSFSHLL